MEPGSLDATVFQQVPNFSFPSGAYCCVVEIDRETGEVEIRNMYLVDDCGTVINPMLVEGQVHGGVAQESPKRCTNTCSTTSPECREPRH